MITREFWQLVREAHEASAAVDGFDLRSEDASSKETFGQLVYAQAVAAAALIKLVRRGKP
jgi:hypothetical protein